MAKLLITTQTYENYGAHDWDGKNECPQYWKAKGGCDYVVKKFKDFNKVTETVMALRSQIESDNDHFRERFVNGDLRDGVGLHQWASAFGDTTNLMAQMQLTTDLANFEKLKTQDCSVQRVTMHLTRLLKLWRSIEGNDIQNPRSWVIKVLATWPTDPPSALAVQLRTWLSGRITEQHS